MTLDQVNHVLYYFVPFFYYLVIKSVSLYSKIITINARLDSEKDFNLFQRICWIAGVTAICVIISALVSMFICAINNIKTTYVNYTAFLLFWLSSMYGIIKCFEMSYKACKDFKYNLENQNNSNYTQW